MWIRVSLLILKSAQCCRLDRKLTELGYAAIMETASDSARALLESLPNRAGMSQAQAAIELELIRARVYFAAFGRSRHSLIFVCDRILTNCTIHRRAL